MKKLLSILMVFAVVFASMLVFASCGKGGSDLPDAPNGYVWYENEDIYFAYPESWNKTEQSGIVQLAPSTGGNNVVVTKSPYDSTFDNITVGTIETYLKPQITAQGMQMKNIAVEHDSSKGEDVAIVTYDLVYASITMDQTLYMFRVGNYVYSVTITEAFEDSALVTTVFNSLTLK